MRELVISLWQSTGSYLKSECNPVYQQIFRADLLQENQLHDFNDVITDPMETFIEEGIKVCNENLWDVVIRIGGGSVLPISNEPAQCE